MRFLVFAVLLTATMLFLAFEAPHIPTLLGTYKKPEVFQTRNGLRQEMVPYLLMTDSTGKRWEECDFDPYPMIDVRPLVRLVDPCTRWLATKSTSTRLAIALLVATCFNCLLWWSEQEQEKGAAGDKEGATN